MWEYSLHIIQYRGLLYICIYLMCSLSWSNFDWYTVYRIRSIKKCMCVVCTSNIFYFYIWIIFLWRKMENTYQTELERIKRTKNIVADDITWLILTASVLVERIENKDIQPFFLDLLRTFSVIVLLFSFVFMLVIIYN